MTVYLIKDDSAGIIGYVNSIEEVNSFFEKNKKDEDRRSKYDLDRKILLEDYPKFTFREPPSRSKFVCEEEYQINMSRYNFEYNLAYADYKIKLNKFIESRLGEAPHYYKVLSYSKVDKLSLDS